MEEVNNMANTGNQEQGQERMFTQEEVNKIVQNRLARAKNEGIDNANFSEREAALVRRELQLDAREQLMEAGLPKELASAINCPDKETMEKSIKTLIAFMSGRQATSTPGNAYKVISTSVSGSSNTGSDEDTNIRKAMGLKG